MTLLNATEGTEYIIQNVATEDAELDRFLFSLGCYSGEPICVVSRRRRTMTVALKDSRYSIDSRLAQAIIVAN